MIKTDHTNFTDINKKIKRANGSTMISNVDTLFEDILSFKKPRWHIIRIPQQKETENDTIKNIQNCAEA